MRQLKRSNNIVWAIDPLLRDSQKIMSAKKTLQSWQKKNAAHILPVSILVPEDLYLPINNEAQWGDKLRKFTEEAVAPYIKSIHLKNMQEPNVIMSSSKAKSIDEFLAHAQKQKADIIITVTHDAKSRIKNRIGKFTQKLIEKSKFPVLTVHPNSYVPKNFKRILFPTDFSHASKKSFMKTVEVAKKLKAQIILFHNIYDPVLPAAEFTGVPIISVEALNKYVQDQDIFEKQTSQKWMAIAAKQGVKVLYHGYRAPQSLSGSILSEAEKSKADMIVLGMESHPILRSVLGSAVRDVIAQSHVPVLIVNVRAS